MGLFRSRKSAAVEPNMVALEEHHKGGEDLTSKVEAVTNVREASVDKDAPSKTEGDASATTRVAEDESKYPTGPKLWLLVLGLCLTIWVVALDNSSKWIREGDITSHLRCYFALGPTTLWCQIIVFR